MCSSIKMVRRSSATWMFPKSPREAFFILRPERHTMRVQRCGVTNPTTWRAIFGRWVAFCMSLSRSGLHSEQMIWLASTAKSSEVSIKEFQIIFQQSSAKLPNSWSKWMPLFAQHVNRFCPCPPSFTWASSFSWMTSTVIMKNHPWRWSCLARSECLRTFFILQTGYQSHPTSVTLPLGTAVKTKKINVRHMNKIRVCPIFHVRSKDETMENRLCRLAALVMRKLHKARPCRTWNRKKANIQMRLRREAAMCRHPTSSYNRRSSQDPSIESQELVANLLALLKRNRPWQRAQV